MFLEVMKAVEVQKVTEGLGWVVLAVRKVMNGMLSMLYWSLINLCYKGYNWSVTKVNLLSGHLKNVTSLLLVALPWFYD